VSHSDVESLRKQSARFQALVLYHDFTKAKVREIAESGERVPSGLTRFIVPRRVLGFNCPLALLGSNLSLEEKQYWLEENLRDRMTEKKVRHYQEPTFVFDD
jgi:hypothetical protein